MIVDCCTYTWETPDQLGRGAPSRDHLPQLPDFATAPSGTGTGKHFEAAEPVDTTIVLGFRSHYLDAEISNDDVSEYVRSHPGELIGFAGIDPAQPKEAVTEMNRAKEELRMPGVAVAPAAQDFHPTNSQAMIVYGEVADAGMPILFHTGVQITAATKLEFARPYLLDEVARELPKLKIVVAHMGYPWVNETIVMLAKHPNVFAEISWILHQPWQAYQALLSAHQYGVMDKLLFGSGFPTASASDCIEALYSINQLVHGTSLPVIPRESLRGIVERDTLRLLGIDNVAVSQRQRGHATTEATESSS
jgi:predicted TIM-barrel fold metal-dependent hydrolase